MRLIMVMGEIDEHSYTKFSKKLARFEEESNEPVHLELCSHGGEEYFGLAFYGRIRNSSVEIVCTAYGHVLSAATLIFAACDYRRIDAACWFMLHDSTDKVVGSISAISHHIKQMHRMEIQWARLLEDCSGTPGEHWRELSLKTSFIDAQTLLQLGLAEEILKGIKDEPS